MDSREEAVTSFNALVQVKVLKGAPRLEAVRQVVCEYPDVHAAAFYNQPKKADKSALKQFEDMVKKIMNENGMSESDAIRHVVHNHPDIHAQYLEGLGA